MMESLAIVFSPKMALSCSAKPKDMVSARYPFALSHQFHKTRRSGLTRPTTSISAFHPPQSNHSPAHLRLSKSNVLEKSGREGFASITSSNSQETSSVGVNPPLVVPPPPSYFGSPLFWIGVGVGLSALFSWVSQKLKNYAVQQATNYATKTMMEQMAAQMAQNNQFTNAAVPPGSPRQTSRPATSPSPAMSQSAVMVDVTATEVEAPPATDVKDNTELKQPKRPAFVDVSPEERLQLDSFEVAELAGQVSQNGAASTQGFGASPEGSSFSQKASSSLSVEALEKMMEDPTVQKMVYPYLPEEMRNPTTFKWMLQNPQYRQQLEDMLNNMGGSAEWDNRMMDSLKNFDLSSPEVKQQFDQIGLTPEEVISKIMANPDIAMAFQNPRVQAAIMDCSQNPMSIAKYQNDKEVMDVFNKISELFPGATGSL